MEPHELVRKTQHTPNPAAQDPDADPFLSIHSENQKKENKKWIEAAKEVGVEVKENEFCYNQRWQGIKITTTTARKTLCFKKDFAFWTNLVLWSKFRCDDHRLRNYLLYSCCSIHRSAINANFKLNKKLQVYIWLASISWRGSSLSLFILTLNWTMLKRLNTAKGNKSCKAIQIEFYTAEFILTKYQSLVIREIRYFYSYCAEAISILIDELKWLHFPCRLRSSPPDEELLRLWLKGKIVVKISKITIFFAFSSFFHISALTELNSKGNNFFSCQMI